MKSTITCIVLLSLMALTGCDPTGEDFPPDPDIDHYTHIVNNSNYNIEIQRYRYNQVTHTINLQQGEEWVFFNQIFKESLPFLPDATDSSYVIYDGSITVVHTKEEQQDVSRSLWLRSSYTGGKVNEKLYEIYYTFIDEDYDEAVELNGGG